MSIKDDYNRQLNAEATKNHRISRLIRDIHGKSSRIRSLICLVEWEDEEPSAYTIGSSFAQYGLMQSVLRQYVEGNGFE